MKFLGLQLDSEATGLIYVSSGMKNERYWRISNLRRMEKIKWRSWSGFWNSNKQQTLSFKYLYKIQYQLSTTFNCCIKFAVFQSPEFCLTAIKSSQKICWSLKHQQNITKCVFSRMTAKILHQYLTDIFSFYMCTIKNPYSCVHRLNFVTVILSVNLTLTFQKL